MGHAASVPRSDEVAAASGTAAGSSLVAERGGAPFRLLVVDDDAAIRELAVELLAAEGYHVVTAEDGLDALRLIDASTPDLVITDLRMPRMSGFELLEVMRARYPEIPVVAVSGEMNPEESPQGAVADAFFTKGDFITPRFRAAIAAMLAAPPRRGGGEKGASKKSDAADSAAANGAADNGAVESIAVENIAVKKIAVENIAVEKISAENQGFHGVADMRAVLGRLAQAIPPAAALELSPSASVEPETPRAKQRSAFGTSCD